MRKILNDSKNGLNKNEMGQEMMTKLIKILIMQTTTDYEQNTQIDETEDHHHHHHSP